ncbi:MAG: hypothetical protein N2504_07070 [candidate division WOR-3 bacterium]|nr:hypothetical protein [candidate division WOR-3 bacterium]MCX7948328.1 hypothetical protein [candidate division WOR-3 bacterium]MDW8150844.1 hypothetical protein [candidate division WOR-3 bacterium]
MLDLIFTLLLQEVEKSEIKYKEKTVERYRGGYFVYIIKGNETYEYELNDENLNKDKLQSELSKLKSVRELVFDSKTNTLTIKVNTEKEVEKVLSKYGFKRREK